MHAVQKRSNTCLMSAPICIEMMRVWSSSFVQSKKFFFVFAKIPRASGQWRPMPDASSKVESGSWNKK